MKKKISLERARPERSETRKLSAEGKETAEKAYFYMFPKDKKKVEEEALKRGYSFSLYVNLVLKGQEKAPL